MKLRRAALSPDGGLLPHERLNQRFWDEYSGRYAPLVEDRWRCPDPLWGLFGVPEAEAQLLPPVLTDRETIELGCGTAYVSAWLARRGARPTGVDLCAAQLDAAEALQRRHAVHFPLLQASAEAVPLPDASFDLAITEYGASLWCDPERWLPEAARLLRPGGVLISITFSMILSLCLTEQGSAPSGDRLVRPARGLRTVPDSTTTGVEFHRTHAEWVRLLGVAGFSLQRLVELYPSESAHNPWDFVTVPWARQWPADEAFVARRNP